MKKLFVLAAAAALAGTAAAQTPAAAPAAPAKPSTFRSEFLAQQDGVEKYLVSLAEAIPAEKYGWRPGDGVRSVSEVLMHITGGNFLLAGFAGVKAPEGLDPSMEKTVTEKAKVIDTLKKSFANVRQVLTNASDADLDKPVKMFGRDTSVRGVLFAIANHEHEHLGQSIAYARMNGIVPPWTEERMKKAAEKAKESPDKK
jgi:uncharacterized damage-inducible protein DinB